MLVVSGNTLQVITKGVPRNVQIMIHNRKADLRSALSVMDTGFPAGNVRASLLELSLKWQDFRGLLFNLIGGYSPRHAIGCHFI